MPKVREVDVPDLDLVPIMNLVLIIIPLLLLSTVFMEVNLLDVTMPQRQMGGAQSNEPPKRLQIMVSKEGFWVITGDMALPTIPAHSGRCNLSICLKAPDEKVLVARYDWMALYNTLMDIKAGDYREHYTAEIAAEADIPFGVVIKAMDVARYQLVPKAEVDTADKGVQFDNEETFNEARPVKAEMTIDGQTGMAEVPLFPTVVLGLPQTR